ncbi:hypothetical protein EV424DRAFT_1414653 [Suillus variegatus]|nr:hypothetical protein EV424DRAFT_1414653 [Suillus variegatus]
MMTNSGLLPCPAMENTLPALESTTKSMYGAWRQRSKTMWYPVEYLQHFLMILTFIPPHRLVFITVLPIAFSHHLLRVHVHSLLAFRRFFITLAPAPATNSNKPKGKGSSLVVVLVLSKLLQYGTNRYSFLAFVFIHWLNNPAVDFVCCSPAKTEAAAEQPIAWSGIVIAISTYRHSDACSK